MADFTHTVTWSVNMDGRAVTFSYTDTIPDITDVQRVSHNTGTIHSVAIASEPRFSAVVNKQSVAVLNPNIQDTSGPTTVQTGYLRNGEMFNLHLSSGGGTFNTTASSATTTLLTLDNFIVSSIDTSYASNYELMILHQAAS